ncbi:hypothetical protein ACFL4F_01965, partial [Candidatus Margulisiibacteriota bacterium]
MLERNKLKNKIRIYGAAMILFMLFFASGCARTVTPPFSPGKTITFNVDFKEDIDPSVYRYYIIINSSEVVQLPFMPIEFIEPGDIPSQPEINYQDYYDTWDYYFVLEGNAIYFATGPFSTSEAVTKEAIATWTGNEPKKLQISYDIGRLYPSPTPTVLYFDFVTVGFSDKIVKDNLSPSNSGPSTQYINTTYAGAYVNGSDEDIGSGDFDITNWSVTT